MKQKNVIRLLAAIAVVFAVTMLTSSFAAGVGFMIFAAGVPSMIKTSKELKEDREAKMNELNALMDGAKDEKGEKRDLNEAESGKYTSIIAEIRKLDEKIEATEELEKVQQRNAARTIAQTQHKKEVEQTRNYSFVRAIRSKITGEPLDGFEGEMHQEAVKEARECGTKVTGIGVPQMVLSPEKRTILAGTETDVIPTEFMGFIDKLMARLALKSLGANFITGLTSNVSIPRLTGNATASWKAENAAADESTHTFDAVGLTPKKLTTYTQYSKQMMMQSAVGIENLVRDDLQRVSALAVDLAGINGSGADPEPAGILQVEGIGSVAIGDNGGDPTYENLIALVKELAIDNADMGSLGFLTNPAVRAKLMATKLDQGSGLFVWPNGVDRLMGYNTAITTQVPSNLTKGTASAICSAIIFGNFSDLLIGQWGGLDLIVDPYTQALYDYVRVVVHSYWDVDVRHAESFAAIVDAKTAL